MPRIAYVNGRYLPLAEAAVSIEDRGYQFADGVYEVIAFDRGGRLIDGEAHFDRLERSLREIEMARPLPRRVLAVVLAELVRRNRLVEGIVYLQVSRGVAPRDHVYPKAVRPALVATVRRARPPSAQAIEEGVGVVTQPDRRWRRCDIKSVGLLPNVMAKQAAKEDGAYEAWMVDDAGRITEGSSTNAWIVAADGTLVTREAGPAILNGVTRMTLLRLAREAGLKVAERPFTLEEAKAAREAFLSSTTTWVLPVVSIDGVPVGNGHPGTQTRRMRALYQAAMAEW